MDKPKADFRGYWKRWRLRAWGTTSFASWARFWQTLFGTTIAYGLQWWFDLRPLKASVQIVLTIIGAYIIVLIGSFLINLFKAPAEMEREQQEKYTVEANKATGREAERTRQVESLNAELIAIKTAPPDPIVERVRKGIAAFDEQENLLLYKMSMGKKMFDKDARDILYLAGHGQCVSPLTKMSRQSDLIHCESNGCYEIVPDCREEVRKYFALNPPKGIS